MDKDLILTCDTGTTGCKCTLFNTRGEALFAVRRSYPTQYPHPNWAEQDPDVILKAMLDGIHELLAQVSPQRIACVGLSGTMNGCIPVDETGKALYPNIIHSDSRTEAQVAQILKVISFEDFYRLTGNRADTHYTLPKILWLKEHEPQVYRNARWFLNIKDYLYGNLTGRFGYTDYSDASLTEALDINKRQWAGDLLKSLGLDEGLMPRLLKGHDVRGRITRDIYHRCGLLPGTPVAIGGGDGACTTRGSGVSEPGSAYCYIGSSAWVAQLLDRPLLDPKARIFNWLDMNGENLPRLRRGAVRRGGLRLVAEESAWPGGRIRGHLHRGEHGPADRPRRGGRAVPAHADGLAHPLLGPQHPGLSDGLFAVPRPAAHRPGRL